MHCCTMHMLHHAPCTAASRRPTHAAPYHAMHHTMHLTMLHLPQFEQAHVISSTTQPHAPLKHACMHHGCVTQACMFLPCSLSRPASSRAPCTMISSTPCTTQTCMLLPPPYSQSRPASSHAPYPSSPGISLLACPMPQRPPSPHGVSHRPGPGAEGYLAGARRRRARNRGQMLGARGHHQR